MPFNLSRAGTNVPAEVQRWQYFLLRRGIGSVGKIDADFGLKTEIATKMFQLTEGLPQTGKVDAATLSAAQSKGYTVLPDDYYKNRNAATWPPAPAGLSSPSSAWRNATFSCFKFLQKPLSMRPDAEAIVVKGDCSGSIADWVANNIVDYTHSAFEFADGYRGYIRCHKVAIPYLEALLAAWKEQDLLHLVISYAGCYVPRYIRGKAPSGSGGHATKSSSAVSALSNHSFGSAFDINTTQNWLDATPALCGRKGSVRELVEAANKGGFYWGGHYSGRLDGMHFEIAK